MKINSRHNKEFETDSLYITCNSIEYAIRDEGKNGLKIISLDNEFTTLSIKPNVANSVNIKASL